MTKIGKLLNLYYLNKEVLTKANKLLIFKSLLVLTSVISVVNIAYIGRTTELVINSKFTNLTHTLVEISNYDESLNITFITNLIGANHLQVEDKYGRLVNYHKEEDTLTLCLEDKGDFNPLIGSKSFYNNWYISKDLHLVMLYDVDAHLKNFLSSNSVKVLTFELDIPDFVINDIIFNLIVTITFLTSSMIMVIFITSQVRISDLISKAGNEAMLSSKNNQKFTEAMHHEVKTPLSVLNSGFDRMEVLLEDLWSNINNPEYIHQRLEEEKDTIRKLTEMVDLNFGIIYNILDKQRNNRAIRYSNGNYNLYDLLQHSFEGLKWDTKIKYNYSIDENFKTISNAESGLSNEDFTNIFTNHIRNSLEANANNIKIVLKSISKGKATVYIADNGKGMSEEVGSMIYLPNFSTKKDLKDSDNQGIGMYLCQTLLNEVGGYEQLEQSGNTGTIFSLVFPVMPYKGK